MDMRVEDGEERVGIAVEAIALDGCPDKRLGEDKIRKVSCMQKLCIQLKQLCEKAF